MEKGQWIIWIKLALKHKAITWKIGLGILLLVVGIISYVGHLSSNDNGDDIHVILSPEAGEVYASEGQEETESPEVKQPEDINIIVDISGAVLNPGIVIIKEGSRVYDAVECAGGLLENADTSQVNLAAHLLDGDKVLIPSKVQGQTQTQPGLAGIITNSVQGGQSGTAQGNGETVAGGTVNINQATSSQLQTLTGVGPATAQKIIDYREKSGGFKKIEDLMNVSGIGTKSFEKIKDKISV